MSYVTAPDTSRLAPETRDQLAVFADEHGHFGELRAVVARFPAALAALDNQYRLIMGSGRLDRWVREAVFAACSAERGNACLASALALQAARHGADPGLVEGILVRDPGSPGLADPVGALITFARKMALEPYKSVAGDVSSLHAAGWDNQDLVEILSVVSLSAYLDTLSLSLHIGPQTVPAAS
jgi:hypothetical protein